MTQTPAASGRSSNNVTAQDEVAGLCSDLIRIDTSNRGDNQGPGERQAAEYVAGLLAEVGLEPIILESDKSRASVITRITGEDQSRPALLIHGHLDVVPADAADWQVDPFSGHIGDASTKSTTGHASTESTTGHAGAQAPLAPRAPAKTTRASGAAAPLT